MFLKHNINWFKQVGTSFKPDDAILNEQAGRQQLSTGIQINLTVIFWF
jgi:hypothetical protein